MSDNTTLIDNLNSIKNSKADIKQALLDKGQQATDVLATYADLIEDIETGIDTSDATATASDIKEGKTAYVDGEKITGIYVDEDLTDVLDAQDQKIAELEQSLENKTAGGGKPNIFVQLEEPEVKKGIWLKTDKTMEHIYADDDIFIAGEWKPDGAYRNIPYSFYQGSAVVIGTDIYLFGSYSSSYQNYAYKYDTLTNTYTKLRNIPYVFYQGSAVAMGTDIYLLGTAMSSYTLRAYKYDTLTDTYTKLTDIPYGFKNGAVAVGTDIYLFGNTYDASYQKYAYKYDILTDTYTKLTNIPYNFYRGSAVVIGTDIYLLGGEPNPQKVQVYSLKSSEYENNSLVIAQGRYYQTGYGIELYNDNLFSSPMLYAFADAWFYTTEDGIITTIPTYYGDGTQWIKFKN